MLLFFLLVALLINRFDQALHVFEFLFRGQGGVDKFSGFAFAVAEGAEHVVGFGDHVGLDFGLAFFVARRPSGRISAPCGAAWR